VQGVGRCTLSWECLPLTLGGTMCYAPREAWVEVGLAGGGGTGGHPAQWHDGGGWCCSSLACSQQHLVLQHSLAVYILSSTRLLSVLYSLVKSISHSPPKQQRHGRKPPTRTPIRRPDRERRIHLPPRSRPQHPTRPPPSHSNNVLDSQGRRYVRFGMASGRVRDQGRRRCAMHWAPAGRRGVPSPRSRRRSQDEAFLACWLGGA
jgi:hypothetical protein